MVALLYIGIKFLAYSAWIFWGQRALRSESSPSPLGSLALGFLRLCLGLFFGVLIYLLCATLLSHLGYGLAPNIFTYLAVYVPVRWIEWSIMTVILLPGSFAQFFVGVAKPDRLWRLGGIVISCLADIPLIIGLGGVIPTGRFLC
jgi:hypothetical protein